MELTGKRHSANLELKEFYSVQGALIGGWFKQQGVPACKKALAAYTGGHLNFISRQEGKKIYTIAQTAL